MTVGPRRPNLSGGSCTRGYVRPIPLLSALLVLSCAPAITLEGAPCPCADGWVCCPGANLCASAAAACPAPPAPRVEPAQAEVGVGRRLRFTSETAGVTWRVEEGEAGGRIAADGWYEAPSAPGTFHVVASAATAEARVTVTVRPLRLGLLAGDYGGPASQPLDGLGDAVRVSLPSLGVSAGGAYFFLDLPFAPTTRGATLRRLDLTSLRVDTLATSTGEQVDGPLAQARFGSLASLGAGGPGELILTDEQCLRGLRLDTLDVSTLLCPDAGTGLGMGTASWVGDERSLYGVRSLDDSVVRVDRQTGVEELLAGRPGEPGDTDGRFGLLNKPTALALGDGGLYVIDQQGTALRHVALDGGVLSTVTLLGSQGKQLVAIAAGSLPRGEVVGLLEGGAVVTTFRGAQQVVPGFGLAVEPGREGVLITGRDGLYRLDFSTGSSFLLAGRVAPQASVRDGLGTSARFVFDGASAITAAGDEVWTMARAEKTLRRVTRQGDVRTVFTEVPAEACAVSADFVYVSLGGVLQRAPVAGGAWQAFGGPLGTVWSLTALDDGRVAAVTDAAVLTVDPVTLVARQTATLPAGALPASAVVDPAGALVFDDGAGALRRLDLATGAVTLLGPSAPAATTHPLRLAARAGRVYGFTLLFGERRDRVFELVGGAWRTLVGEEGLSSVRLGPLDRALVNHVADVAVLANGDVAIADGAEGTLLVVE